MNWIEILLTMCAVVYILPYCLGFELKGRKYKDGDNLKVGQIYGYATSDNQFKLIGLHDVYAWVEWQDSFEIETINLASFNLKTAIIILK